MSAKSEAVPAPAEIQAQYNRFKNELQALASKIGELENDIEEHDLVLSTLSPLVETDSSRKCFRLIGGVLVERTVKEVEPELRINTEGIQSTLEILIKQYKVKQTEFETFQKKYKIQVVNR
ncbi:hypothetical protein QFC22_002680 [Naganishia vaughanmartiniae]|uniref:Uncharacterized protein n=1 Tax=Naganishia vaughanmartiniae TaxID=1424756 RepID=A0ACC2XBK2_9TREE|nr:hypothetical protein QFC22_002680 [Naganishia vaughanmartiniae]